MTQDFRTITEDKYTELRMWLQDAYTLLHKAEKYIPDGFSTKLDIIKFLSKDMPV